MSTLGGSGFGLGRAGGVVALFACVACSASNDLATSASSSSGEGGVAWSTSASSGQGGAGGAATSGGGSSDVATVASGSGVGSSSVQANSSAASTGSGGAPSSGRAIVFAVGTGSIVGASFDGVSWSKSSLTGGSDRAPALGASSTTSGLAVWRASSDGKLMFSNLESAQWASPAPVGPNVTTQGAPSLAKRGTSFDVAFHGDDYKHYFASFEATWSPVAEAIGPTADAQSFGPAPGAVAAVGQETAFAFAGDDGGLYHQARVGGVWQAAVGQVGASTKRTPAMVALSSGAELLAVFSNDGGGQLMFATRSSGVWSQAAVVEANAFSNDPPALAALPGGEALLVFRGLDGKPYTSRFASSNTPPWSVPKPLFSSNPVVISAPSVAPGLDGYEVELAFVAEDGKAYHSRLLGDVWSPSVFITGDALIHVAIVSHP